MISNNVNIWHPKVFAEMVSGPSSTEEMLAKSLGLQQRAVTLLATQVGSACRYEPLPMTEKGRRSSLKIFWGQELDILKLLSYFITWKNA